MPRMVSVLVGGIPTACVSRADMVSRMISDCRAARQGTAGAQLIFDVNGHGLAMAKWNAEYRCHLLSGDLIHADGQWVVLASRFLTRTPIPERTATTDFFLDASQAAVDNGLSFYLLGATEDVNHWCELELRRLYPGLRIAGRRHGYFQASDEDAVCDAINESGADVLWVGLGKPHEQAFCSRNKQKLKPGWVVTCGGCFNYVVGAYPRAPRWMQDVGLEWLHRLSTRPKSLLWRYLTTNLVAIYLLLTKTRTLTQNPGSEATGR